MGSAARLSYGGPELFFQAFRTRSKHGTWPEAKGDNEAGRQSRSHILEGHGRGFEGREAQEIWVISGTGLRATSGGRGSRMASRGGTPLKLITNSEASADRS